VERCVSSRIDDSGSWRHEAVESRWRTRVEVCVQGGVMVTSSAGLAKFIRILTLKMVQRW
jgi:hypothetical protein